MTIGRIVTRGLIPLTAFAVFGTAIVLASASHEEDVAGTPATVRDVSVPALDRADRVPAPVLAEPEHEETDGDEADHPSVPASANTVVAELPRVELETFAMLGVTWKSGLVLEDTRVQAKWRTGGTWTAWTELDIEPSEQGTPGTEPIWVEKADAASVRVISTSGAAPQEVELSTIDPGKMPTVTSAAAFATASAAGVPQPSIIRRAAWGASNSGTCDSPIYGSSTQGVIIHHTAGSNSYSKSQSASIVKATQAYHTGSRKWCDIGYNFLVDKYGQIFEGRKGGIDKGVRAAHSGNGAVNEGTVGISLMGTFTSSAPSSAMKSATADLAAWKMALHGIPAKGTYRLGGKTLDRIAGHRNVVSTACPGAEAYSWVASSSSSGLRQLVASKLANSSYALDRVGKPSATSTADSVTFTWSAVSDATSYDVCLQTGGTSTSCTKTENTSALSKTFKDLGPTQGTDWYGKVRARDGEDLGQWSELRAIDLDPTASLAQVGTPSATSTTDSVTFTWSAVSGATSYEVCLQTGGTSTSCTKTESTSSLSKVFKDLGPTQGTDWYGKVRARDGSKSGPWSGLRAIDLQTGLGRVGTPAATSTTDSVTFTWSSVSGAATYDVCLQTGGTSTSCTKTESTSSLSKVFNDLGPTQGTDWYGKVRARSGSTVGAWSELRGVNLAAGSASASLGRVGTPSATSTTDSVTFTWSSVSGAATYDVCLQTGGTSTSCTKTESTSSLSKVFNDLGPTKGTDWYGKVRARSGSTTGAWSELRGVNLAAAGSASVSLGRVGQPSATSTTDSVTFTWSAVSGATSYEVCLQTGGTSTSCTKTESTSSLSKVFEDLGPTQGTDWYGKVRARDGSTAGAWSELRGVNLAAAGSSAPLGRVGQPSATSTTDSVRFSWSAVSGAASYDVCLQTGGTSTSCTKTVRTGALSLVFEDLGPTQGTDWYGKVRARSGSTVGAWSELRGVDLAAAGSASTSLGRVGQPSATSTTDSVTFSWSSVSGAATYDVCLQTGGTSTSCTKTESTSALSKVFEDLGPTKGTDWYGKVRARNGSTVGAWSELRAIDLQTELARVGQPSATSTTDSVTFSWSSVSGAATYDVCLQTGGTSTSCTKTESTSSLSKVFNDLGPTQGTDWYGKVRARSGSTVGAWSELRAIDLQTELARVGQPSATSTTDSVTFTWSSVSGAATYDVCLQTGGTSTSCTKTESTSALSKVFKDLGPTQGTDWYGKVRARNGSNAGAWSELRAVDLQKPSTAESSVTVPSSRNVTFEGHGYGHGIGMSQYGAEGAARAGRSYSQILDLYYPGTDLSTKTGDIKVLISQDTTDGVIVNAQSGLKVRDIAGARTISLPTTVGGKPVVRWMIAASSSGSSTSKLTYRTTGGYVSYQHEGKTLSWSGDGYFYGPDTLSLVLPNGSVTKLREKVRSAKPSSGSGKRDTVNVLSIENYVRGVVAAEMPSSWSAEALKAQSVAARTYGVRSMGTSRYYDICSTTACQVYGGASRETASTDSAIKATAGKILTYKGSPALAQFSSSSGGYTNTGSQPYLKAVNDPYDGWSGNKNHDWTVTVKASTIEKAYSSIGTLKSMQVTQRNGHGEMGGRVSSLKLVGSKGTKTISGVNARWAFGLRSDWFGF